MKNRDLGELGELTLRTWCAQVGIVSNPVTKDKTGWDNLVEFPLHQKDSAPLDKVPTPIACLIQVKATDRKPGRVKLKLDNCLRLVRHPGPAFMLALEFDGQDQCQRAFLVHLGEDFIRRILKRLRELSKNVLLDRLHKHKASVSYRTAKKLSDLSGSVLKEAIETHIQGGMDSYVAAKNDFVRTTGYEGDSARITFSYLVPDLYKNKHPEELLVDFAIGVVDRLEVTEAELWDLRFGVPFPERTFSAGGELTLTQTGVTREDLILRGETSGREARIPVDLFVPPNIAGSVQESRLKLRVVFPGGEFIFAPGAGQMKFNFSVPDVSSPHDLHELIRVARLIRFFDWGQTEEAEPVRVWLGDGSLGTLDSQDLEVPRGILDWASLVNEIGNVLKHFALPSDLTVTIADAYRARDRIRLMSQLLDESTGDFFIHFTIQHGDRLQRRVCYPAVVSFPLDKYRCVLACAFLGEPKADGEAGTLLFNVDKIKIHRKNIVRGDELAESSIVGMLTEVGNLHDDESDVLVWWADEISA